MVGRNLNRGRQRGLTLIELLVVIVILALASTFVLLNAPPSRPAVREDAERFAARMQIAFDDAIATGANMRVSIDTTGYAFETLKEGEWTAVESHPAFGRKNFDKATTATVEIDDAANDNSRALGGDERAEDDDEDDEAHRIPLDPLGAQAAFKVRLSSARGVWTVSVTDAGAIAVDQDA